MQRGTKLDELARDLASGEISRRGALKRMAAAGLGLGAVMAPAGLGEALASGRKKCPKSRRCGDKCCPKNAVCKQGKCKCKPGFSKCGKKCVDFQTNPQFCGNCDTVCDEGRACVDSQCEQCSIDNECPMPSSDCEAAVCDGGFCGTATLAEYEMCSSNGGQFCDGNGSCVECLNGSDCQSQVCDFGTNTCAAPTCSDGVQNGDETDTDCGGSCGKTCQDGQNCNSDDDCIHFCVGGVCIDTR